MNFTLGTGDGKVKRYISLRKKAVPKCMRFFMVRFYRECTLSTPVDTGRARWGWNCSISTPDLTIPPEGQYTLDTQRASNTFTISAIFDKNILYISNAVHYVGRLNEGWSKQAPARFVELAFENSYEKLTDYIYAHGYMEESEYRQS